MARAMQLARRRVLTATVFVVALALAALVAGAVAAPGVAIATAVKEKEKVRVGAIKALGTVTPYIAERAGFFDGQGIDVELVPFIDGPTLMQAFAAGGIDVGYVGVVPAAIWWSKGIDLKVVASTNGGGHAIAVRADSNISKLGDLRGRLMATPSTGSVTDVMLRAYILKRLAKLDPGKDLRLLPGMAGSDMVTALNVTREVEAAMTWEPFIAQMEERFTGVRVIFDAQDYWRKTHGGKGYTGNVVLARGAFIKERPDVLRKFMAIHRKTTDFINGDEATANKQIAAELKLPVSVIQRARTRTDFTYEVDVAGSMELMEFARELGYIKTLPEEKEFFALTF